MADYGPQSKKNHVTYAKKAAPKRRARGEVDMREEMEKSSRQAGAITSPARNRMEVGHKKIRDALKKEKADA